MGMLTRLTREGRRTWFEGHHKRCPLLMGLLCTTLFAAPSAAQPRQVEVDPVDCWWRTSQPAVQIGERFTVTLTCAVAETEQSKVVIDPSQLDPSALSLAPFEIVSGRRHEDVVEFPYRRFQHEFVVRILTNAAFGQDANIPSISLKYAVQSANGETAGRELIYALPPLPIHVVSLVSTTSGDIRDLRDDAFTERETRERRGANELAAAVVAFGFAAVLVGLAVARAVRHFRAKSAKGVKLLGPRTLLRGSLGDLHHLNREVAREGWSLERAARALTDLRVASAVALGEPVAQVRVERSVPVRQGQLAIPIGLGRSRKAIVSAGISERTFERRRANLTRSLSADQLNQLRESIRVFTSARYSRHGELDAAALDVALQNGAAIARRARLMTMWPLRMINSLSRAASTAGVPVWSR